MHRCILYMDAAYCYRRSRVMVCLSVCRSLTIVREPTKTAEPSRCWLVCGVGWAQGSIY